ncbi:hypothetical protein [Foetidibacter luteolus]|uniref:hypothetical protein n=1 Tax=Foetidibacter luteolus TaxID=2608880 RepID=UPI00129A91FF|nr:hypothetical protein [Foetidibacter luteolus]
MGYTASTLVNNRILQLEQAIFYNCSGFHEKLPVNIVRPFNVENDRVIWFSLGSMPLTYIKLDRFAGELFFYKKGEPYSITLEGVAEVVFYDTLCIKFTVSQVRCQELVIPQKKEALHKKILPLLKVIPNVGLYFNRLRPAVKV